MISLTLLIAAISLLVYYVYVLIFINIFFYYSKLPLYYPSLHLKQRVARQFWQLYDSIFYEVNSHSVEKKNVYYEYFPNWSWDVVKKLYFKVVTIITAKKADISEFYYFYFENSILDFFLTNTHNSKFTARFYQKPMFNIFCYNNTYSFYFNWREFKISIKNYYYFLPQFVTFFKKTPPHQSVIESLIFKNIYISLTSTQYINIFFQFFKSTAIAFLGSIIFFYFLINYFYINILKQVAIWIIIGFLFFWLISGFNFFLKKGAFGKLTSALLRFWKRTNIYFWLVEGFLFLLFFYYYLNSSQEPNYMYDYSSLNQNYLPNLYTVYTSTFLLVIITYYFYYWVLNLPNFSFQQNLFSTFIITSVFLYFYLIESYQFYYVITLFFENLWVFNHETNLWVLEYETPRMRVKSQYLILALIAKYWHFIFIFLSWIFFIMKIFEQKRPYYTHTGFNLQNLIILFWLNFLFIVQWFKWTVRRFGDSIYYWFFTDSNFLFFKYLLSEFFYILICAVRHFFAKKIYNRFRLTTVTHRVN